MAGQHSIIPPSSAPRRVQCQGSALMELMHPETEESQKSKDGTATHQLGEMMIDSFARGGVSFPAPEQVVGQTADNGVVWEQWMYDAALLYAEDVRDVMQSTGVFGGPNLKIEQRVHNRRIHEESWGTPDCSLFDQRQGVLYVWDGKFGHKVVDAFENWQMVEYATGLVDEITGGNGWEEQHIRLVLTIIQPRAQHRDGPVRRWRLQASDLRPYANYMEWVEHRALSGEAACRTGPECKHCSARGACDTLAQAVGDAGQYVSQPISVELSPQDLAVELNIVRTLAKVIEARKDGLEAQAEGMITAGHDIPGFALERGQGRQKWNTSDDQVFALGDMLGIDLRNPPQPVTPKQAIKKGIDESVIKDYSETPSTGLKLVESNKTVAATVFQKRK